MKRSIVLFAGLALLCFAPGAFAQDARTKSETKAAEKPASLSAGGDAQMTESGDKDTKYVPVLAYDPARNADQDIRDAVAEAGRTNRRVLVEVGGLWCIWCHYMDEFFDKHPDALALREKNFVMVKINVSDENKNAETLSRYPKVAGYPHIFILDGDGKLLHSQDTEKLEEGKGYNLDKFKAFLTEWASAASDVAQK
jgi:thiol-disulfide isomerase/thioredoxin